jgi:HPt (histidine-containing phosphotransfer) domain-containing protein
MSGFGERMAQLRARFVSRAPDERARLLVAMEDMDRDALRHLSHRLSGSSGLFGFPEISLDASAVEEAVEGADDAELRILCSILLERLTKLAAGG